MIDLASASAAAAALHLTISALLVLWTIFVANRITRRRDIPRSLLLLTGLGGLLIAPAVFVEAMTGSVITGRALYAVAWLWPATSLVMLAQAVVALSHRLVPPALGAAFIVYDALIAGVALVRYALFLGGSPIDPLLALSAAEAGAMEVAASALATGRPYFLFPPLLAPALPKRRRGTWPILQGAVTVVPVAWSVLLLLATPPAFNAVRSFRPFARERLQERPRADLAIGARLFPTIEGLGPPDLAVTRDVSLARELELGAISIHIAPGAATEAVLDSVAATLDAPRDGGAVLIAVLAVTDEREMARPRDAAWRAARMREIDLIVRRLRPEYMAPVAPDDIALARIPIGDWTTYLEEATRMVRRTRPRTRVMVPLAGFSARDSLLYEWAMSSGLDAVGFRLTPSVRGGEGLEARLLAADRWIEHSDTRRVEHWLLEVGAWPLVFGERNQERAIWGTLTWASRRPTVRGVVVHAASDYGAPVGLRAVSGRIRPAGQRLASAVRGLREAVERNAPQPSR